MKPNYFNFSQEGLQLLQVEINIVVRAVGHHQFPDSSSVTTESSIISENSLKLND